MSLMFKRKDIFGNTFDAYKVKAYGNVFELLLQNHIKQDGTVIGGNLSQLWSYIYLLYMNNRTYDVFDSMRGRRGRLQTRATAKRFINTVKSFTGKNTINEDVLKLFINQVIVEKKPKNPIIEFVQTRQVPKIKYVQSRATSPIVMNNPEPTYTKDIEIIKDIVDYKGNNIEELVDIIKTRFTHNKLVDALVKLSGAESPEDIANKIKQIDEDNKNHIATINHIKTFLKREIRNPSLEDIEEILQGVHDYIIKMKGFKHLSDKASSNACQKQLDYILNVTIYSKMCLLKYIAQILATRPPPDVHKCDREIDVSKQRETFNKLPKLIRDSYLSTYKKHKDSLLKYKHILSTMDPCDINVLENMSQDLIDISHDLSNIFEDLFGSVRVFIRLRQLSLDFDDIEMASKIEFNIKNQTKIQLRCDRDVSKVAFKETEYFGVFGPDFTNLEMYTGKSDAFDIDGLVVQLKHDKQITDVPPYALYRTFKQLEQGYSIVLSGYGLSGSGKSTNFMGTGLTNPGVIHYGLRNLDNVERIEAYQVFELYYNFISPNDLTIRNKIILSHDSSKRFVENIEVYGVEPEDIVFESISLDKSSVSHADEYIPLYNGSY